MPLSSKCTMHFRWSFIFSTYGLYFFASNLAPLEEVKVPVSNRAEFFQKVPLGRILEELGGVGRSWEELGGVGRSWEELGGVGRSWEELGGVGRSWEELGGVGRSWEELGGVGVVWLNYSITHTSHSLDNWLFTSYDNYSELRIVHV